MSDRFNGRLSRRQLLRTGAGALGAAALGGSALSRLWPQSGLGPMSAAAAAATLPPPGSSGIEHVVVVMMENRSFDHFLGWVSGANGKQAGLRYRDRSGVFHSTYALAPDYQGCGRNDPDHSYTGGRIEYDGGRCDGWLLNPKNDIYSIGYYTRNDLRFLGSASLSWTVLDNYHAAIMAETYPNRIYQHAGQTDRLTNTSTMCTLPTIWDRLAAAGLSGRYYYGDVPFTALWGPAHLSISRDYPAFLADCKAGTLPNVAFVDPRFEDEGSGTSGDDHPHADIRTGEAFLNQVYRAITQGAGWPNTVLVVTFDEWGGFFDHVTPTAAPIPAADKLAGNSDGLRGFRVPSLVISPWSPRGAVSHYLFDHTSTLRMIEWRWGLQPLSVRDKTANNLALALDFQNKRTHAPQFSVPTGPFGSVCGGPSTADEWSGLRQLAEEYGFVV